MKDVINADEYQFEIRPFPNGEAHGVYVTHERFSSERLLFSAWTVSECKNWITSHFIGKKGTKFNIVIKQGEVIEDENGYLHLEYRGE